MIGGGWIMYQFWGQQILCNMSGLSNVNLNDTDYLISLLRKSVVMAEATLVEVICHRFSPEGATIIAVLKESHVAIHTYPEHNALFFDAFTCGTTANPKKIAQIFIDFLKPNRFALKTLIRSLSEIREKSS